MSSTTVVPRARRLWLIALAAVAAVAVLPATASAQPKPTIVLVHGAFADASGWTPVIDRLQRRGYTVKAPANPLRSVSGDAAYLRSYLSTIPGPIVLVGHSYGGVVITNAATGNPNVKALVYVAAFAPDENESVQALGAEVPGGQISPATLDILPFPKPDGTTGLEATIKTDVFRRIFAADLPARQAAIMAASQRPASLDTLGEPSGPPAWKTIPSWYLRPTKDLAIGTDLERFMAQRMGATTVVAPGASHVVMLSRPTLTTRLILNAAGDPAFPDARRLITHKR